MTRYRITIEVDTDMQRDVVNAVAKYLANKILDDKRLEVVYLATEIAPNQETRQRNIIEDIT